MRWARVGHDGSVHTVRVDDDDLIVVDAPSPLDASLTGISTETGMTLRSDEVEWLAPLIPTRNVFCVGWNYLPHFDEGTAIHGERPLPDRPNFFTKTTTCVIGPYDRIPRHAGVTNKLDWEVELGVVIGRRAVDIEPSDAMSVVAGYLVAQDATARDVQHAHGGQWFRGKSLDGTCPIGPWLVDAADVEDAQNLEIWSKVNGEEMQHSNTSTMIFPIDRLLAELSRGLTLLPGDLVLTGTPEGVGQARTPPRFLQVGDVVESCVDGIGLIRNEIV